MIELPADKMDLMVKRFAMLESELANGPDSETYVKLASEYAELEDIVGRINAYRAALSERDDLNILLSDKATDGDMRALAEMELPEVEEKIEALQKDIQLLLLPKDAADTKDAILEIRAGTGGLEAALFAGDLFRMYERYAAGHGWKIEIISASEGDAGGYKEIIANVKGTGVFAKLKFESGVHRVQRVPATETQGRVHTSTVTVAVLPEAEAVDIEIKPDDLEINVCRASGPGGQGVNTTDSAVQIQHKPSGMIVRCMDGRSQQKNKEQAMKVLRSRLLEQKIAEEHAKYAAERKSQIGTGERNERIRTYNFPQNRVTDHRIELTLHSLPQFMEGEISEMIQPLIQHDLEEKLAAIET